MSGNIITGRGDFRGDFSRDTFDPMKHFSRVLMQQGRVQLDADWNEQVSILLHYMRQLSRDLMGPHGAPKGDDGEPGQGFKITAKESDSDFLIGFGRYYVNGILCELCENNAEEIKRATDQNNLTYLTQQPKPDETFIINNKLNEGTYLVYLDVWERHLTCVEDDYMREKALGGADTASRAQVVWQVKVTRNNNISAASKYSEFLSALKDAKETKPGIGMLKARAGKALEQDDKPCLTTPEATYRGAENQLYRVEIHHSNSKGEKATFKWSRENGSVIFPITEKVTGETIILEHLGRDDRFGLQPGDWVELLDDDVVLRNKANPLVKVKDVNRENLQVTLEALPGDAIGKDLGKHPYLRRWDQKAASGVITIQAPEPSQDPNWIELEHGIQVQFPKTDDAVYQTGDYWLIPTRTATNDVEWPQDKDNLPEARLPHGVQHHYAPLAIITVKEGKVENNPTDIRRQLGPVNTNCRSYMAGYCCCMKTVCEQCEKKSDCVPRKRGSIKIGQPCGSEQDAMSA